MTIQTLEVQNKRLKTLRTNQPVSVKAHQAQRREFVRKESFGSLSGISDNSDTESIGAIEESWYDQNRSMVQELANVGLKTPKSVKKALKRRTVRIDKSGCGCKGNCGTKLCGCVKLDDKCGRSCKCNVQRCKNRADGCDPELEISLNIPKRNILDDIISDEELEKENKSNSVQNDDSDFELPAKKRSTSSEEAMGKKLKTVQRKS